MPNTEGIDYAEWRPTDYADPAWSFACRYVSYGGNPKNLTPDEANALTKAGKSIVVVFETSGADFTGRFNQGAADAREADAEATACGMPADRPIYFAVDEATQDWGDLTAYFQGIVSVIGLARTGVYGSFAVCAQMEANGVVTWMWQTYAWSGGQVHPGIHLYQYNNGNNFDNDRTSLDDFGQWGVGKKTKSSKSSSSSPTTAPTQEGNMIDKTPDGGIVITRPDGSVFADDGAPFLGGLHGAKLNKPIVGIAVTPTGKGYWLVGSDGGVFCYGDAKMLGNLVGHPDWHAGTDSDPCIGIASEPANSPNGYVIVCDNPRGAQPSLYRFPLDGSLNK